MEPKEAAMLSKEGFAMIEALNKREHQETQGYPAPSQSIETLNREVTRTA
jgi:hypothetical protein